MERSKSSTITYLLMHGSARKRTKVRLLLEQRLWLFMFTFVHSRWGDQRRRRDASDVRQEQQIKSAHALACFAVYIRRRNAVVGVRRELHLYICTQGQGWVMSRISIVEGTLRDFLLFSTKKRRADLSLYENTPLALYLEKRKWWTHINTERPNQM